MYAVCTCPPTEHTSIRQTAAQSVGEVGTCHFHGTARPVTSALLVWHKVWFGVTDLAWQAMVSPTTASQVLNELERLDWLALRGQGPNKERHQREPNALLDAWAGPIATTRAPLLHRYYVPGVKEYTLATRLGQVFGARKFNTPSANDSNTPFLSNISHVRMLIGDDANAAIGENARCRRLFCR